MLTSTQNPKIKHLVRMRDNRARRRAGVILVDGWRETRRAIESGLAPTGIYALPETAERAPAATPPPPETSSSIDASERWVRTHAADHLTLVTAQVMEKIAYGQSDRGVVAEFAVVPRTLNELRLPPATLILVLDRFEKPGNVGAAFRCADAAGVGAVILTPESADPLNPNAIRSSLGTVFSVPYAVADEADAKAWLAERGYRVFAARVESSLPLWQCDFSGAVAIVIGNEAAGLKNHWSDGDGCRIDAVRIPMRGSADSLNASASAAVLLYEACRQRLTGRLPG